MHTETTQYKLCFGHKKPGKAEELFGVHSVWFTWAQSAQMERS